MKTFWKSILLLFFCSCSSRNKMGRVSYGENGRVINGSSVTRCTHPDKRYAKSIEAIVQASVDSLVKISKSSLNASLKQSVTRLNDYSTEGLDIDLILFRICEMANNRGFTSSEIDNLTKITLEAWANKGKTSFNAGNINNTGTIQVGDTYNQLPQPAGTPVFELCEDDRVNLTPNPGGIGTYKLKVNFCTDRDISNVKYSPNTGQ